MLNNISKCILIPITTYFNYKECNCHYQNANNRKMENKAKSKVEKKKGIHKSYFTHFQVIIAVSLIEKWLLSDSDDRVNGILWKCSLS